MKNALKELYEETFGTLHFSVLDEKYSYIINNRYKCYVLCLEMSGEELV